MHEHITSFQHTNSDGQHSSTAAPIAVGGHYTDCVHYIVGQNDWNTCCTDGESTETWTDNYSVVDWSPTIILWGLPLHSKSHTVPTILLDNGRGSSWRRRETYMEIISKNSPWLSTADRPLWLQKLQIIMRKMYFSCMTHT